MKSDKRQRNRIANVLGVLSILAIVNYWVAVLSNIYDRFGGDASLDIVTGSLAFSFVTALTGIVFKRKNKICRAGLALALLLFFALILFAFPFAQLEWMRP